MDKKIIIIIMLMVLLSTTIMAIGIGVPTTLDFKQPLRNKKYVREMHVQTTTIDHEGYNVMFDIEEHNNWFSYDKDIRIEAGERKVIFPITLKVPKRTKLGDYEIKTISKICPNTNGGIGICVGATSEIIFEVTKEKIIDGYVDAILTQDTYYGKPLCIRHALGCYGNVPCRFKVIVDTEFGSFFKNFKTGAYSSIQDAQTCVNIDKIDVGYYHANTKVYLKQGKFWQVIGENNPHFNIFEEKTW